VQLALIWLTGRSVFSQFFLRDCIFGEECRVIPVWKLPELHELTTTIGCWCQTVQYGRNRAVCVPKSTEVVASLPTPFATVCQSLPFSETLTAKEPPEVIRASFTVITGRVRVPDEGFGLHNGIQLAYAPRPSIFD